MDENHLHLQTTIEWLKGASIIHGQGLLDTSALEGIQVLRVTCRIFTLQLHHTNSPCRNLIFSLVDQFFLIYSLSDRMKYIEMIQMKMKFIIISFCICLFCRTKMEIGKLGQLPCSGIF